MPSHCNPKKNKEDGHWTMSLLTPYKKVADCHHCEGYPPPPLHQLFSLVLALAAFFLFPNVKEWLTQDTVKPA